MSEQLSNNGMSFHSNSPCAHLLREGEILTLVAISVCRAGCSSGISHSSATRVGDRIEQN